MVKTTTDVDRIVGLRIAALRKAKGLSQSALGDAVGVTFQQVQKYEKGQNRIGASRLHEIAKLLEVPVATFFENLEIHLDKKNNDVDQRLALLGSPGAFNVLQSYAQIRDPELRKHILALIRRVADCDAMRSESE